MTDQVKVSSAQFAALSRALKAAGEGTGKDSLRGQMMAEIRAIAQPIVNDARSAVLGLDSTAKSTGHAHVKRAMHGKSARGAEDTAAFFKRLGRMKRGKNESQEAFNKRLARARAKGPRKAETEQELAKRISRSAGGKTGSLRASVARSIRIVVKDSGFSQQVGVRITTDGSRLPAGQKYLPRGLDSDKGWRHPVFGHDAWVQQYGNPPGWFRSTARAHHPYAIRRIDAVLARYMNHLAAKANRAA